MDKPFEHIIFRIPDDTEHRKFNEIEQGKMLMSTLVLPKGTARALRDLTGEPRPDIALLMVLRDALTYRLEQIDATARIFETKYGMTFNEYRKRWESEDLDEDYHWEAERDFLEWEALVIQKCRLEDVYGWLP